jgi:molecular chaperone HtpG
MASTLQSLGLFQLLKKKEEKEDIGTVLSTTVVNVSKQVEPILGRIPVLFKEYTLHDISHSDNVIKNMGNFIPKEVKDNLNALEVYLLLLSAYLHDVGMAVKEEEITEIKKSLE